MDLAERKEFLVRTPFFGGLEDEALDRIIQMLVEREYAAGATVFREGEQGRSMYVVRSGELVKCQSGESGRSVKLMRFHAGDFFGETTLIEMQPRQFTVTVENPARLYELTNMDLYRLYKQDINAYVMVLQNINRELCRRLRRSDERITELADSFGDSRTQIGMSGRIRRLPEDK
jgi:CRP/FNR family transcriptional regulator, cyclic AMP receptor protein